MLHPLYDSGLYAREIRSKRVEIRSSILWHLVMSQLVRTDNTIYVCAASDANKIANIGIL